MEKKNDKPITVAEISLTADVDGFQIGGQVDKTLCLLIGYVITPEDPESFYERISEATREYVESLKSITRDLPIFDEAASWTDIGHEREIQA